jgi:hypothetical protein
MPDEIAECIFRVRVNTHFVFAVNTFASTKAAVKGLADDEFTGRAYPRP